MLNSLPIAAVIRRSVSITNVWLKQQSWSFHAVLFGDGAVGVGQQGNAKLVRVVEPGLYGCVVGADPDSLGAEGSKFDSQVTEMA